MKTQVQERAGMVIENAHAAGMLYVPPTRYEIKPGLECTWCKEREQHKQECLPPFGLRML